MKFDVIQMAKRSALAGLLACVAASTAFAQGSGSKPDQHNVPTPPTQNVLVINGTGQPLPTAPQGTTNVAGTVNIGNMPTVSVGNTPAVTVANTPTVNIANTPEVTLSGTPTVNANAIIAAAGPLTNVGRLASQQVELELNGFCPTDWAQTNADGSTACFDMASYPGQVLIVTDITWLASGQPGITCITNLYSSVANFGSFIRSVAVTSGDNYAARSEHLTTGAKMTVNPALSNSCLSTYYQVKGYLVPNQ